MMTMRCGAVGISRPEAQARAAAIVREISKGLWAPALPTVGFDATLRGRPQPRQVVHSASSGCGVRSAHAVAEATPGCTEKNRAARRGRVGLLLEPPALVGDGEPECMVEQRPFDGRRRQRRRRAAGACHGRSTRRGLRTHAARSSPETSAGVRPPSECGRS